MACFLGVFLLRATKSHLSFWNRGVTRLDLLFRKKILLSIVENRLEGGVRLEVQGPIGRLMVRVKDALNCIIVSKDGRKWMDFKDLGSWMIICGDIKERAELRMKNLVANIYWPLNYAQGTDLSISSLPQSYEIGIILLFPYYSWRNLKPKANGYQVTYQISMLPPEDGQQGRGKKYGFPFGHVVKFCWHIKVKIR